MSNVNPHFAGMVASVAATAEAALGGLNAATSSVQRDGLNTPERARVVADRSLALLLMLAEKTRGNLSFEEAEILSEAIAQVRALLENASEDVVSS